MDASAIVILAIIVTVTITEVTIIMGYLILNSIVFLTIIALTVVIIVEILPTCLLVATLVSINPVNVIIAIIHVLEALALNFTVFKKASTVIAALIRTIFRLTVNIVTIGVITITISGHSLRIYHRPNLIVMTCFDFYLSHRF